MMKWWYKIRCKVHVGKGKEKMENDLLQDAKRTQ
jgi:hypothetical protein